MTIRIGNIYNPEILLKELGYKYRRFESDWVRKELNGRFHVKIEGNKIAVHYDFFGPSGSHITNIPMPYTLGEEQKRISSYISKKINERKESIQTKTR